MTLQKRDRSCHNEHTFNQDLFATFKINTTIKSSTVALNQVIQFVFKFRLIFTLSLKKTKDKLKRAV